MTDKELKEGRVVKGGVNQEPSTPRPKNPPAAMSVDQTSQAERRKGEEILQTFADEPGVEYYRHSSLGGAWKNKRSISQADVDDMLKKPPFKAEPKPLTERLLELKRRVDRQPDDDFILQYAIDTIRTLQALVAELEDRLDGWAFQLVGWGWRDGKTSLYRMQAGKAELEDEKKAVLKAWEGHNINYKKYTELQDKNKRLREALEKIPPLLNQPPRVRAIIHTALTTTELKKEE